MSDNPHSADSAREYKEIEYRKRLQSKRRLTATRNLIKEKYPDLFDWLSEELRVIYERR